ncbi:MAG TPA: YiiX/YebB-like N1pC/P60 family cysteine hydrolase [Thermoanaerobaculia bacterium]|jgi:hypothetical protein
MKAVIALLSIVLCTSAGAQTAADRRAIEIYRAGILAAAADLRAVAKESGGELLTSVQKQRVRATWGAFLDYLVALDNLGARSREERSRDAAALSYAAFLAQYRGSLEVIDAARTIPGADAVLNESVPSVGLPPGTFAGVKRRWLNVARATEFAALESLYRLRGTPPLPTVDEDAAAILRAGRARGPLQTAENALRIAGSAAFTAWFPVQKGVAEWMGDTRVARADRFLITPKQIAAIAPRLQPGDVFLERREWYVSNIGLPGFWPHAALYIGRPAERARAFDGEEVRAWVREQGRADGDFEAFLRERDPAAYRRSLDAQVIEAISEGVSLTTLEHSAAADSFAVLRPRASRRDKAIAIARAFSYLGRPYDFDFDFHTDRALVCSEVVYKAYEGAVALPLSTTMNRLNTPPNEIVREFDASYGKSAQQFDFVLFLDGHERKQVAVPASVDEFRASWKRPKWHIVTR